MLERMKDTMPNSNKTSYLSKSLYMRGLQCRKSLYLDRHNPELRTEPTAALESLWRSGHEVGDFAHRLFPGGVIVPFDGLTKEDQLARTRAEIDRGAKVIYEAAFSFNDVFVKADIIVRERGYWNLYEGKSTTSVKENHWDDAAVQYYVLSGCGLPVHKAFLVHIDSSYVRKGEIVPQALFSIEDITGGVREKQASIPDTLSDMRAMLRGKAPVIDIGPHCDDPYECDFKDHCWKHVPEQSIFALRPSRYTTAPARISRYRSSTPCTGWTRQESRRSISSTLPGPERTPVRRWRRSCWARFPKGRACSSTTWPSRTGCGVGQAAQGLAGLLPAGHAGPRPAGGEVAGYVGVGGIS